MTIEELIREVRAGRAVSFLEVLAVIEEHYRYVPCRFRNGLGEDPLVNEAGTNEGSCKVFCFARLHGLDEQATLELFGDYYRQDVLNHPEERNHANIRRFMRDGWGGIQFDESPLAPRGQGGFTEPQ